MDNLPTVSIVEGDGHDGRGWYYIVDEYPDEGSCGAFASRQAAVEHAAGCGHDVSEHLTERDEPA